MWSPEKYSKLKHHSCFCLHFQIIAMWLDVGMWSLETKCAHTDKLIFYFPQRLKSLCSPSEEWHPYLDVHRGERYSKERYRGRKNHRTRPDVTVISSSWLWCAFFYIYLSLSSFWWSSALCEYSLQKVKDTLRNFFLPLGGREKFKCKADDKYLMANIFKQSPNLLPDTGEHKHPGSLSGSL